MTRPFFVILLAALALAVALTPGLLRQESPRVEAAGTTPDLAMAIDVDGGGDDCDTRASTMSIGTTCSVTVGSQFTMRGYVDSIAGLVNGDGDGDTGYVVFQFRFLYTSPGLTRNDRTGSGEVGPDSSPGVPNFWHTDNTLTTSMPCSPNTETDPGGNYYVDCWGPGTESTYTGKLVEVDFTCDTVGTHTITMDDAGSYIHNDLHGNTPLDKEGNETLTISCSEAPVGGIAELPVIEQAPSQATASSGPGAGLLAAIASLAAVITVSLGGTAWYATSRIRK